MPHLKLHFWGRLSDRFGASAELPWPEIGDIDSLKYQLAARYDVDAEALFDPSVRLILNGVMMAKKTPLSPGDRVEFLPPVGGG